MTLLIHAFLLLLYKCHDPPIEGLNHNRVDILKNLSLTVFVKGYPSLFVHHSCNFPTNVLHNEQYGDYYLTQYVWRASGPSSRYSPSFHIREKNLHCLLVTKEASWRNSTSSRHESLQVVLLTSNKGLIHHIYNLLIGLKSPPSQDLQP